VIHYAPNRAKWRFHIEAQNSGSITLIVIWRKRYLEWTAAIFFLAKESSHRITAPEKHD